MKILTFGEIMLRLKTPEHLRIVQANGFEASYGGAESNVAVSLSTLGDDAAFLTKLPDNPVGNAAFNELRRYGVDTSRILRGARALAFITLKREMISVQQAFSTTGPEVPWQKLVQLNLTGKPCSPASIFSSFPALLLLSVRLWSRPFPMR